LLLLSLCSCYADSQEKTADTIQPFAALQEQVASMKGVVSRGLAAINKPAPNNPFNPDTDLQKHSRYSRHYVKDALLQMDKAVKEFVQGYLQTGITLEELITATNGTLVWSEWPKSFNEKELHDIRGIQDTDMTDEEWLAHDNDVVILYQILNTQSGNTVYVFQNSFRAIKKSLIRACSAFYAGVAGSDGETHFADLYAEYFFQPRGISYIGSSRWLLGFLVPDSGGMPGIMIFRGPDGRVLNFGIDLYLWNPEHKLWEGVWLWSSDYVLSYNYNGETTDFNYYQCQEQHIDSPDTLACPATLNLLERYLREKEALENYQSVNGQRFHHILMPPKELYEEKKDKAVD